MTGRQPIECLLRNPDYCLFATNIFLPLLMQLEAELQGVVRNDDIEYVHRSRVATRRIRAAFPLFTECLPADRQRVWEKQIRRLTRSLGEARDLDVQIGFVREFLAMRNPEKRSAVPLFSLAESISITPVPDTTEITIHRPAPEKISFPFRRRLQLWFENHRFSSKKGVIDLPRDLSTELQPGSVGEDVNFHHYSHPVDQAVSGLECLLLRQIQSRQVMQPGVCAVVSEFINSGIIHDFAAFLHDLKVRSMLESSGVHSIDTYEHAFVQIMARISDLFWFEIYLQDPTRIDQHHSMRIAAKRLRYTLEAYADLYPDNLKSEIKGIKRFQELLGDIHDCDVWIDFLPRFLEEEKQRSVAYFGNHRIFDQIVPGIHLLTLDRRNRRVTLFQELNSIWDTRKEDGFWNQLSEKISSPLQQSITGSSTDSASPLTIALISDVHANLPALEAVLADAESRGASVVLHAGDLTGYGPFPDEVINLVRSRHILSVIGNYDLSVLSRIWKKGKPSSREKQLAMKWALHTLSKENRIWLSNLPRVLRLCIRGVPLLVTHGSPDSLTEYLDNGTPDTRLHELAAGCGVKIIVTGHSHRSAAREVDGVWFINAGSVGRSEDGDPRACYALLTMDPFSLIHIRVPYEIERTVTAIHDRHLPDSFARIVKEGRSLEAVRGKEKKV